MTLVVGEAELLIHANTAGLDAELAGAGDAGMAKLGTKAETAGQDIGAGLSGGVGTGAKDIGQATEKDLAASTGRMENVVKESSGKMSGLLSSMGVPASLISGWGGLALGVGAVGAVALDLGAKMQKADASIAAASGSSVKSATAIGNAFLSTGGKSEFSGQQQATAYAAVAGQLKTTEGGALSTADAMTVMKNATDLATASGTDLATTTSTLGGLMQTFQIPISGVANATNVLFNASNATGQGLDTLAASLEKTRSRLGATSPPMADLTALMVDMTKNGVTGRAALTGLNSAMTALMGAASGSTKANLLAEATLKQYGVSAVQANGQLTPMSTIIEALAPKFATMTKAQQLGTATLIFGAAAAKAMTAVIDGGVKSYQQSTDAVTKHNAVTTAAAIKAHTLSGEMAILKTDIVDEGTKLGEILVPAFTALAGAILPVINDLMNVVGWFTKGSAPALAIAGIITAALLPALINMGVQATVAAAKAVAGFVTTGISAMTNAAKTVGAMATQDVAVVSSGATIEATDAAIVTANEAAGASFTAMLGPIGLVAAAGVAAFVITTKALDALRNMATVKPSAIAGKGLTNQNDILAAYDKAHNIKTTSGTSGMGGSSVVGAGTYKAADEWYKKMEAEKKKKDAAALNGTTKAGDAYIAPVTAATTAAHKHAASTATHAATKAASTLTSEVLKAISLPATQAAKQLELLGIPARKATQVLHDATLPFTAAVKALEKEGFSAADAVKIADAGTKANIALAKKTATAAHHSATSKTGNAAGLMVNGVEVSGAVYAAAIGAAYGQASTAMGRGSHGAGLASASLANAARVSHPPTINIQSGAVIINPAPGNDHASLLATQDMVNQMLHALTTELQSGITNLSTKSA